jgi:hypothetical protein
MERIKAIVTSPVCIVSGEDSTLVYWASSFREEEGRNLHSTWGLNFLYLYVPEDSIKYEVRVQLFLSTLNIRH